MPYCCKLNPDADKQHEVLVGQNDKLIVQWDMRANEIVQNYDEHLGAVNTITFIDDNRRFVSTSDDKKMFVWEYGIPVVIKHIADPTSHSMPAVCTSRDSKWYIAQSMSNELLVFNSVGGKFKQNLKKRFVGHLTAGYAIQPCFSPDGKFLVSGDAQGRAFFWDFKTGSFSLFSLLFSPFVLSRFSSLWIVFSFCSDVHSCIRFHS